MCCAFSLVYFSIRLSHSNSVIWHSSSLLFVWHFSSFAPCINASTLDHAIATINKLSSLTFNISNVSVRMMRTVDRPRNLSSFSRQMLVFDLSSDQNKTIDNKWLRLWNCTWFGLVWSCLYNCGCRTFNPTIIKWSHVVRESEHILFISSKHSSLVRFKRVFIIQN